MAMDLIDGKATLVQVMAWCRQATSHYLSQCWPRSLSPYGIIRPQWVNKHLHILLSHMFVERYYNSHMDMPCVSLALCEGKFTGEQWIHLAHGQECRALMFSLLFILEKLLDKQKCHQWFDHVTVKWWDNSLGPISIPRQSFQVFWFPNQTVDTVLNLQQDSLYL